jgi:hypothetical protein
MYVGVLLILSGWAIGFRNARVAHVRVHPLSEWAVRDSRGDSQVPPPHSARPQRTASLTGLALRKARLASRDVDLTHGKMQVASRDIDPATGNTRGASGDVALTRGKARLAFRGAALSRRTVQLAAHFSHLARGQIKSPFWVTSHVPRGQ